MSVELRVEVSGTTPALLLTRGVVADISQGGVRCDIDFAVPIGTKVDLTFPDIPGGAMSPQSIDGRVTRTISPGGVPDQVAIAFTRPLERFDAGHFRSDDLGGDRPASTAIGGAWALGG